MSVLEIKVFRFTLAISIAFIMAYLIGWPLSFLTPILLASLIQSPLAHASAAGKALYTLKIILLILFGQALSYLTPVALASALTIALLLFYAQYVALSGADPFLVVIFIISILLLPLMSMDSNLISLLLMGGLIKSSLAAIVCLWFVFALIPESKVESLTAPVPGILKHDRIYIAGLKTILIMPAFLFIFCFQLSSQALVLIFITILMQMPTTEMGVKGSIGILLGNILGAIVAVIAYNLLSIMPNSIMIIAIPMLITLILSPLILKPHKLAPVFATALTTSFSVIGLTTMAYGDDAGDKSSVRIIQIAVAGLYSVIMLALAEPFIKQRLVRAKLSSI